MARTKKKRKGNEAYDKLVERYRSLKDFTDEALDQRRKMFIQEVIVHYDMVEFGILYFGELEMDLESIYYDRQERQLMLHISSKEMEGDILFSSLQRNKQKEVVDLIYEEMVHIEEGPTLLGMMVGKDNILYRNVFIEELNTEVMVSSEDIFNSYIKEGSKTDDKFYCYVPTEEFFKLNDTEFEEYEL